MADIIAHPCSADCRPSNTRRVFGFPAVTVRGAYRLLVHIADAWYAWQRRLAERQALGEMDDRALRDIGLTRGQLEEAIKSSRPIRRPPAPH